jgi:hypothetical protein
MRVNLLELAMKSDHSYSTYDDLFCSADRRLKSVERRSFQAEVAQNLCFGNARHAERRFGWGRHLPILLAGGGFQHGQHLVTAELPIAQQTEPRAPLREPLAQGY